MVVIYFVCCVIGNVDFKDNLDIYIWRYVYVYVYLLVEVVVIYVSFELNVKKYLLLLREVFYLGFFFESVKFIVLVFIVEFVFVVLVMFFFFRFKIWLVVYWLVC